MRVAEATLTNRLAWITDCDDATFALLRDFWSIYPDGYQFSPKYKMWYAAYHRETRKALIERREPDYSKLPGWDGKIRYFKRGNLPSGLFLATQDELKEKHGIEFKISYDLPKPLQFKLGLKAAVKQYAYQDKCADAMCAAIPSGGGIVLAATGAGKTSVAAKFMSRLPCNCLFVVDQIDLLYQYQAELSQWLGEPVGVV